MGRIAQAIQHTWPSLGIRLWSLIWYSDLWTRLAKLSWDQRTKSQLRSRYAQWDNDIIISFIESCSLRATFFRFAKGEEFWDIKSRWLNLNLTWPHWELGSHLESYRGPLEGDSLSGHITPAELSKPNFLEKVFVGYFDLCNTMFEAQFWTKYN